MAEADEWLLVRTWVGRADMEELGLAFLPRQPQQLVIGTICQADRPLHSVHFSAQPLALLAQGTVGPQCLAASIQILWAAKTLYPPEALLSPFIDEPYFMIFQWDLLNSIWKTLN